MTEEFDFSSLSAKIEDDQKLDTQQYETLLTKINAKTGSKTSKKNTVPDTWTCIEEIVAYIKKHKIPSFNINDKKFRTTQIERIVIIMKELYNL